MTPLMFEAGPEHHGTVGVIGDPPPPHPAISQTTEVVFTATLGCLVAVVLALALVHWRRTRTPLAVLMLLGGGLAAIQEPMVDTLGTCTSHRPH